ncbi:MAG: hypothetical protein ACRD7E_13695, partial [Bryobacteraceae bacterium]
HLPWVETRNGWANFDIDTDRANPQLIVARDGSRYERATIRTDRNDFGPRFGFAYRAGDKSVIRGGYGVYFAGYEAMGGGEYLQTNPPFHYKAQIATDRIQPTLSLQEGLPSDLPTAQNAANIRLSSYDRGGRHTYSQQWSFSIQRELPANSLVEIGYQANAAHKLMRWTEGNPALPGPGNVNLRRMYRSIAMPGENVSVGPLASSWRHEPSGNSNYHSLQIRLEKRLSAGLSLLSSYQWSKAISDSRGTSGAGGSSNSFPQNPFNLAAERSLADEHRAHRFVASFVYDLPFGRGKALLATMHPILDGLLGGWTIAGITTANGGRPVTLSVQGNPSNTGGPDRPDVTGDWRLGDSERSLDHWFNTSAFASNAPFTFGNAGRNALLAPREVNLDLAIHKSFPITEQRRLQFRAEAFNATNTPQFGAPNTQVGNPNFGVITSAGRPRNLQLALKFIF